ncbi:MAG: 50S ribosomal protein L44e [Candidatus Thorarchaeota archaeon]|nr:50S ribosomal protein L44e [Candidatus Thorarchaeota archaeon]
MRVATERRTYCPRCKNYTVHQVSAYKKGKDRTMAEGARRMVRRTRGYGSFPKPIQKRFSKTTKKTMFKVKCKDCGYILQTKGMRLKKVDLERV